MKKRKKEKNKESIRPNYIDLFDRGEWDKLDEILNKTTDIKKQKERTEENMSSDVVTNEVNAECPVNQSVEDTACYNEVSCSDN
jgi:hypothetical protein